jgi:hypothetical protein
VPEIGTLDKGMVYMDESPMSPISKTTRECLLLLRSSDARSHPLKSPQDDLSETLTPIHTYVVHLATFHTMISRDPSSNVGENYAQLRQLVLEKMPSVVAPRILKPFFYELGVEVKEDTTFGHDNSKEQYPGGTTDMEVLREMNVVRDALASSAIA